MAFACYKSGQWVWVDGDKPTMAVTHVNGNRFKCTSQSGHEPYLVVLTKEQGHVRAYCSCPSSMNKDSGLCKHAELVKKTAQEMGHPIFKDSESVNPSTATIKGSDEYVTLLSKHIDTLRDLRKAEVTVISLKAVMFDMFVADANKTPNVASCACDCNN